MSNRAPRASRELTAAREKVERACALLLSPSPEALDQCAPLVEAAVAVVAACREALEPPVEPGAAAEGRRLQAQVRRAWCLLEAAAAYQNNWAKRLATLTAGYNRRGEPAAVASSSRMSLRG